MLICRGYDLEEGSCLSSYLISLSMFRISAQLESI